MNNYLISTRFISIIPIDIENMKSIQLFSVLVFAVAMFICAYGSASGRIWIVDDDGGLWSDHNNIQDAVDNATDGDIILVLDGVYNETIEVNKSVELIGNGTTTKVVGTGNVFTLSDDFILLTGFNINSTNYTESSGIKISDADNCTLYDNIISEKTYGIFLEYSGFNTIYSNIVSWNLEYGLFIRESDNNLIYNNEVYNNGIYGMRIRASDWNRINNNSVFMNDQHGIYADSSIEWNSFINNSIVLNTFDGLLITLHSSRNIISWNTVSENGRHGVVLLAGAENHSVNNNTIVGNDGNGIHIHFNAYSNNVENNTVMNNSGSGLTASNMADGSEIWNNKFQSNAIDGIGLLTSRNNVSKNNISMNGRYGIYASVARSKFTRNNISNNVEYGLLGVNLHNSSIYLNEFWNNGFTPQAFDGTNGDMNFWDNGTIGNYWSDYPGYDQDGDGIGDDWYLINGSNKAMDRYPRWDVAPPFDTWIVDDDNGTWSDFNSIQDAVNVSSKGDLIRVYDGIFPGRVLVNRSLSIVGNGTATIVNGTTTDMNVVEINVDNIRLSNLNITGGGDGILISSNNNIIENNTCHGNKMGITCSSSLNNTIQFNTLIENDADGIYLHQSSNNIISDNYISNNSGGISVFQNSNMNIISYNRILNHSKFAIINHYYSNSNRFENNSCYDNNNGFIIRKAYNITFQNNLYTYRYYSRYDWSGHYCNVGFQIWDSEYIIIRNSTLRNGAIEIMGEHLEHWNSHVIDDSNTINRKPVYYWKNRTGGNIPIDASQVILANCTDVTMSEIQITTNNITHYFKNVDSCVIANLNAIESNAFNLVIFNGTQITIINCEMARKISVHQSDHVIIQRSTVIEEGILIYTSDYNKIMNNTFIGKIGVLLAWSNENQIFNNYCSDIIDSSIWLHESSYNTIGWNEIEWADSNGIEVAVDYEDPSESPTPSKGGGKNTIVSNTISYGDWYAINLTNTTDNLVYRNNLIENGESEMVNGIIFSQAYDSGNHNQWDNGDIGNRWSDWNRSDPYAIDGSAESFDYHPIYESEIPDNGDDNSIIEKSGDFSIIPVAVLGIIIGLLVLIVGYSIFKSKQ